MTVDGFIGNTSISFLVDTGASCTLLSEGKYQAISREEKLNLKKLSGRMLRQADGTPLSTMGKLDAQIRIGSVVVQHEVIVAKISDEGIIGYDFLAKHGCKIDVGKCEFHLNGKKIHCAANDQLKENTDMDCQNKEESATQSEPFQTPLQKKVSSTCENRKILCVANTTEVMPQAEQLLEVTLKTQQENTIQNFLVEPLSKFEIINNIKVAPSLTNLKKEQIIVRVVNPNKETTTIFKGTEIAQLIPVTEEINTGLTENEETYNKEMSIRYLFESKEESPGSGEEIKQVKTPSVKENLIPGHLASLFQESTKEMNKDESEMVASLLRKYQNVFQKDKNDLGRLSQNFGEHEIPTGDAIPIRQRPRRTPIAFKGEEEKEIEKMLEMGVVRHSTSPWASPIVLVRKKDGSTRFCVDYTKLNKVTIKDSYPLPRIDDCLDSLAGSHRFSSMDLASGYWQIPMAEKDKPKTAFVTKSGLYEFNVLPFGLTNAPSTFERTMEVILQGCQWKTCLIYLDDIIVFGKNHNQHIQRLAEVMDKLQQAGLKLKPSKCQFFQKSLLFLGHMVSEQGITTDPAKIEALKSWPNPKSVKDVRSFLGFCSYYRRYVPHFADISAPLCELTQKNKQFCWDHQCQDAFNRLKQQLVDSPILAYPLDDELYILDTDASEFGIGAVLTQLQPPSEAFLNKTEKLKTPMERKTGKEERVISFSSRTLSKAERNYCVTRKELLAVITFIKQYRHFLLGRKFLIRTDHRPLQWVFKLQDPTGQIARWQETLASYDFDLIYRPGQQHGNADGMSRRPYDETKDHGIPCGNCKKCSKQNEKEIVNMVQTRNQGTKPKHQAHENQHSNWFSSYTQEDLKESQENDPVIAPFIIWKEQQKRPDATQMIKHSPATRNLWLQWDSLILKEGVLYKQGMNEKELRLILPSKLWKEAMQAAHDNICSGHLGETKTYKKLVTRFYWYQMKERIKDYISCCEICGRNKKSKQKNKAPHSSIPVSAAMDCISTDLFGPLPESKKGNKYILLLTDLYTKWIELIPIPDATAETCATKIINEFIGRFGCPITIHSDQGRNYESELFQQMCKLLEIRKTRSSPRHPQSNGIVERLNQTMVMMIRAYLKGRPTSWDENLGIIAGAYRASTHETTGYTPNKLMLGRENRMPIDVIYPLPKKECQQSYGEYVTNLQKEISTANDILRQKAHKTFQRKQDNDDLKPHFKPFNKGDLVYLLNESRTVGKNPKLQCPFEGPYIIIEKKNDLNYVIQISSRGQKKLVHYEELKKCTAKPPSWIKGLQTKL